MKKAGFIKKKLIQFLTLKSRKTNPWPIKTASKLLSNPNGGFLTLEAQKT